jgi:hypothetical protein
MRPGYCYMPGVLRKYDPHFGRTLLLKIVIV